MEDETIKLMFTDLKDDISKILSAIEGNGQPGLKIRVDRLEQDKKDREEEDKDKKIEQRTKGVAKYGLYASVLLLMIKLAFDMATGG